MIVVYISRQLCTLWNTYIIPNAQHAAKDMEAPAAIMCDCVLAFRT